MNGKRRLLGSFNHGSMANAMPQAIGAKATAPERQVVAMCGDGGFSMLMGDFLSLAQMKLPVKIVIFNNSVLGFVAMEMKAGAISPTVRSSTIPTSPASLRPAVSKVYALKKPPRWMKRCRPPSAPTVRCWSTSSSPKRNWRSRRRSSWSRPKALACICCGRSSAGAAMRSSNWRNQLAQVKQKQYVEPDQGKAVIDLRSDTVTRPGRAMLEAMMAAPVGTMCMATTLPSMNCSAMPPTWPAKKRRYFYPPAPGQPRWPAQPLPARRRVYRRPGAHNYLYEAGGAAVLGSIQPQPIDAAADGSLPLDKVAAKIKPDDIHFAPTRLLSLENTHNGRCCRATICRKPGRLPASAIWRCTSTARASLTPWWPTAASYAISPNTATPSPSACQRGLALR